MKAYLNHEKLNVYGPAATRCGFDRVAHASRVLVIASSRSRTFPAFAASWTIVRDGKDCFGATPKPARETHALPIIRHRAKKLILHSASSKRKSKNE
jgi:hypothetical protein